MNEPSKRTGPNKGKKIIVAGAGCAGLASAIALAKRGHSVTILERLHRVGGLAGGIEIGNNTYEYGPHIFHTTDPEVLADVKRIAGSVLIPYERTIKIKFLGRYFDFPLKMTDIVLKLPIVTLVHAVLSLVKNMVLGFNKKKEDFKNSEEVLKKYYGNVLYEIFFKNYIFQVWGIYPKGMSPSFALQRVTNFDFIGIIEKLVKKFIPKKKQQKVSTSNFVEKVEGQSYTTKKGYSLIVECFAEEFKRLGGKIQFGATLNRVLTKDDRVVSVDYDQNTGQVNEACDILISTIPISILPKLVSPSVPHSIRLAAESLRYRAIVFVGILVNRKRVLPASFMYFRDRSFNRVTDLSYFEVETEPSGATMIIAEVTCQPKDSPWTDSDSLKKQVVAELKNEGIFTDSDILETHIYKTEHGYPIYEVNYEKYLDEVCAYVDKVNGLYTIGRQGRFAYINTHVAFKMGYDLARKI